MNSSSSGPNTPPNNGRKIVDDGTAANLRLSRPRPLLWASPDSAFFVGADRRRIRPARALCTYRARDSPQHLRPARR